MKLSIIDILYQKVLGHELEYLFRELVAIKQPAGL